MLSTAPRTPHTRSVRL